MERFPVSIRLVGVMHKQKCKLYITSVLWSDQNEIVVYRTFEDYYKIHKTLKKAFPPANKLKKSDKIIPRFHARTKKNSNKKKGPTRSLVRLKILQKYCDELLKCDSKVCQSNELIQFFHPKDNDLDPEFAKNGILILPSEEELGSGQGGGGGGGNVTQPFVTESYRCVAQYETKDTKNKPFKVNVDEHVDVLIKDKAGWWLVEKENKMAWFPAPYLEKAEDEDDDDDVELDGSFERGVRYTAVKSYKAAKDDEISVAIGAVVEVLQMSENGWWFIRYGGKSGYIPTMYLQPYNFPQIRLAAQQGRRSTSPTLLAPPRGLGQGSQELSRSSGNLQLKTPSSPSSLGPAETIPRSRSLNVLGDAAAAPPPPPINKAAAYTPRAPAASPVPPPRIKSPAAPPPQIKVQLSEEQEEPPSFRVDSFSDDSEFSEFSDYSDELSDSSASSSFNLSPTANQEQLRLSRTPPPTYSNTLSPTSITEGKLMPSRSDPNLYKGPVMPKVPPRPRAQDILTRCSTVTRKNASKGSLSPTQMEIPTR